MTRMTLDDLVVPDTAAAAGSSLENVLKYTVYCTSVDKVRRSQHHLRPLFPSRAASAGLLVRPGLARDLRHRGGLRRHHLTLRPRPRGPAP
jgi:hypothetical protein